MDNIISRTEPITESAAFILGNYTTSTLFNYTNYSELLANQREQREEGLRSQFISPEAEAEAEENFSIITAITYLLKNINHLIENSTQNNTTNLNQIPEETYFVTVGFLSIVALFFVITCTVICFFEVLNFFKSRSQRGAVTRE